VVLVPGVRFRLGPAEIECCAAEQPVRRWDRCPFCGRNEGLADIQAVQRCPRCGREVVVLEDTERARVVLPARQGEYVLERELGRGGMAWVWKARRGARAVAVKILMPPWAQEEGRRRRFAREWELLRRVRHPRVVPVLGHGEWRGLPCLVMPVLDGGSLQQVLNRPRVAGQPPCTFEEASVWFADVLEGLEALHRAGLVHGDIKPSNILLDETGHALLADLGIAREVGAETEQTQATAPTGRLGTGTYLYMAPEQWENPARVDRRADLYSVGATFYHLLTGRLPLGRYPPASELNKTVPRWFDWILNRLLASRPEERYESVSAVLREFERCRRRRGWGVLLAGTMLVGALCGAVSAFLLGSLYGLFPGNWHFGSVLGGVAGVLAGMGALVHWVCRKRSLGWKATCWWLLVSMLGSAVSVLLLGWLLSKQGEVEAKNEGKKSSPKPVVPKVVSFTGHKGSVWSVAVSADGRYVVSGSGLGRWEGGKWIPDDTVRLWDLELGQEVRRFTGHRGQVYSVSVSPDERYVVSGSDDRTVRVWELGTGREVCRFTGHNGPVYSVAVTPDGRYVVSGSGDGTVRLCQLGTGQEVRRFFTGHERQVFSVAVTPDGRYVVSGSWDGTVRLWELGTGEEVRRFRGHGWGVSSVAVTPDGRYVVSGGWDGTVRLWELGTGQEVRRFMGTRWVTSVAVTPDRRYVVSGSEDRTVRVWELETGQEVRRFTEHMGVVWSVAVTPDGRYVVSGSWDGTVRLWYIGDLK
jgi:WD40 repeat protein